MKALIIVDWENEWINPESEYYIGSDLQIETSRVSQLIKKARAKDFKIIFIKHNEKKGDSFKLNSDSTDFIKGLDLQSTDIIINKYKISPFYQTNLESELEGMEEVFICGILTNLCVRSTVSDLYDRDFKITVIEDCCVAFDKETHEFTLRDLQATRPEIQVIKSDSF